MMLTNQEIERCRDGFSIIDCAIIKRDEYSFLLAADSPDGASSNRKRLLNISLNDADNRLNGTDYNGFSLPCLAVSHAPQKQSVMIALDGGVAVLGAGDDDMEQDIPYSGDHAAITTSVQGVATIDGYVYATGPWRSVCRRLGPNQWESIVDRASMPMPARNSYGSNSEGFTAIAGFHANDIYCVGGHGDAWRFDGKRWHCCPLPTNMLLESVCCAGDGLVYIGMQNGSVLRGREDSWQLIHRGDLTLPFKDMVWFDGRVWCTSDYGVWSIEQGKLTNAPLPPEVRACAGNLAVGDGVLLLAGRYGATLYDGSHWERLL
jgi:hypothetical protein